MKVIATVLAGILLIPQVALSNEFDYLIGDVNKFTEDLATQEAAKQRALQEIADESGDELFPGATEDEGRARTKLEETSPYLQVKIHGIDTTFFDVPSSAWFIPYVREAMERGIVSGYRSQAGTLLGLFGPADTVTIEQLAKIAVEARGINLIDCAQTDIKNKTATGSWSRQYVSCTEDLRWAVFSDGSVDVKRPATRSEVVVTLLQAFDALFTRGTGLVFNDVGASTQFSGAIEKAAADGVVSGYADSAGEPTGEFGPDDPVNRAEIAKIVTLAIQVYGNP